METDVARHTRDREGIPMFGRRKLWSILVVPFHAFSFSFKTASCRYGHALSLADSASLDSFCQRALRKIDMRILSPLSFRSVSEHKRTSRAASRANKRLQYPRSPGAFARPGWVLAVVFFFSSIVPLLVLIVVILNGSPSR